MSSRDVHVTNNERTFDPSEIIVSKTDTKGRLTYFNSVFMRVGEYDEAELKDQPHSILRHPDMPRCVFKLLWDTISAGKELFAYVKNRSKSGDFYWVLAHVTPTFDAAGNISGYHSNRRVPSPEAMAVIKPLYAELLAEEQKHGNAKDGMQAGFDLLVSKLDDAGMAYEEFIHTF